MEIVLIYDSVTNVRLSLLFIVPVRRNIGSNLFCSAKYGMQAQNYMLPKLRPDGAIVGILFFLFIHLLIYFSFLLKVISFYL